MIWMKAMNFVSLKMAYLLLLPVLCCSCATIMNGTRQTLVVRSDPAGARVTVDGEFAGETPCEVELARGSAPKVVGVEKSGHEAYRTTLKPEMSDWGLGNIVLGGPIGAIVDLSSGAFYEYAPGSIDVTLPRSASELANPKPASVSAPASPASLSPSSQPAPPSSPVSPQPQQPEASPIERKLSYLREMHEAGAMTGRQVREELSALDIPPSAAAAFLKQLGIRTE